MWAPGLSSLELPEDVGIQNFQSAVINIHYNNPDEDVGQVDSSGVRVFYTEELRSMNMGLLELGDPFVAMEGTLVPEGKSSVSFSCPSSCTETYFEVGTII